MASKSDETTTYEIETTRERFRFTVPASWKVTFGMLHPGTKPGYGEQGAYVLRFYESKEKQRAVFQNVKSFRDISLPLQREVRSITERRQAKSDNKGNSETASKVEVEDGVWEDVE